MSQAFCVSDIPVQVRLDPRVQAPSLRERPRCHKSIMRSRVKRHRHEPEELSDRRKRESRRLDRAAHTGHGEGPEHGKESPCCCLLLPYFTLPCSWTDGNDKCVQSTRLLVASTHQDLHRVD